jgi:enoyl-CoA hydratase/carnithine racemase
MTVFDEYRSRYPFAQLTRREGILEIRLHTKDQELVWNRSVHSGLPSLFADVGADPETRAVILTGTGSASCAEIEPHVVADVETRVGYTRPPVPPETWDRTYSEAKRLLMNLLEIEVPIIAAVNGPAHIHAELAVLSDIVIAADNASFQDKPHLANGVVPGDGAHIVWPMLLGVNRGRYFLLTGQVIDAEEARQLGVVNEVVPRDRLLDRAYELARGLAELPPLATRYTRVAMTQHLRRRMLDDLGYGIVLEGLAAAAGRGRWTGGDT